MVQLTTTFMQLSCGFWNLVTKSDGAVKDNLIYHLEVRKNIKDRYAGFVVATNICSIIITHKNVCLLFLTIQINFHVSVMNKGKM